MSVPSHNISVIGIRPQGPMRSPPWEPGGTTAVLYCIVLVPLYEAPKENVADYGTCCTEYL